ncbi:MAG: amidohydrolase family protein [Dyella sp.]|uniref:amidohydrolase family protein n=1 Tax=Dyella sp. TaxID=1869338 RepID=UPI003F7F9B5E
MSVQRPARVVDGHCHLASSRCIPSEFFAGVADNLARKMTSQGVPADSAKLRRMLQAQYDDHGGDKLIAKMDEAGIAKTVLLAPDFSFVFNAEYSYPDLARQHAQVRQRHPGRFYVFLGVDPRWGKQGHDFFEYAVREYAFEGLKLYPPCGYSPSDEMLFPLYEICRDYGLPVLLHTGPTTPTLDFEHARPWLIDGAARQFPTVNFILAHGGVNFVEEAKLMCHYRPNVYLDFSGFPAAMVPGGWRDHLSGLFKQNILHKIIFGTDWPVFSMKDDLGAMVSGLLEDDGPFKGAPASAVEAVMGGTIESLLPSHSSNPILRRAADAPAEILLRSADS